MEFLHLPLDYVNRIGNVVRPEIAVLQRVSLPQVRHFFEEIVIARRRFLLRIDIQFEIVWIHGQPRCFRLSEPYDILDIRQIHFKTITRRHSGIVVYLPARPTIGFNN